MTTLYGVAFSFVQSKPEKQAFALCGYVLQAKPYTRPLLMLMLSSRRVSVPRSCTTERYKKRLEALNRLHLFYFLVLLLDRETIRDEGTESEARYALNRPLSSGW